MSLGDAIASPPGAASAVAGAGRRGLLALALPMVVSRAGLAAMVLVDSVMVARYGSEALAVTILAQGTFGRLVEVFLSVLLSFLVLFAAAQGAENAGRRIALWHRSLLAALGLGLAGLCLGAFATPILSALGQDEGLARAAGPVVLALGIGLPAGLVAIACAIHLEGAGHARSVALWVLAANGLNLGLNGVLVGGHLGFPELGALGSAISTSLVRGTLAAALVWCVLSREGPAALRPARAPQSDRRAQWALGGGAFAATGAFHGLAIWLTVFAGWLGALPLAAYASAWLLVLPGFLLFVGVGDALALRLSKAEAEGASRGEAAGLLRSDLGTLALVLLPFTLAFALLPGALAQLYTSDPALALGMAALLPISGLVLLLDGFSYAFVAALRARRDAARPMAIQVGCMVATPILASFLAFERDMGLFGLVAAILSTSTLRFALLAARCLREFRSVPAPVLQQR